MSDIVMKSNESVCEGTGKKRKYQVKIVDGKKIWFKFCPSCNDEQRYSSLRAISWATTHNKICYRCVNSGENNPFFGKSHSDAYRQHLSSSQSKCSYRYKSIGHNPPKVKLVCKLCKNSFEQIKSKENRKYCCYKCALKDSFGFTDGHKTSPEIKVETILKSFGETYQYGYVLGGKIYDFYLPKRHLLLEVDGIYWHAKDLDYDEMNATQLIVRSNDLKKVEIAKKNGYNLARIWEDEINEIKVSACIRMCS